MNYKKIGAESVFKKQCEILSSMYEGLYACLKFTEGGNVFNTTFDSTMKTIKEETEKLKQALEEYKAS